jgi:hypothetical protein
MLVRGVVSCLACGDSAPHWPRTRAKIFLHSTTTHLANQSFISCLMRYFLQTHFSSPYEILIWDYILSKIQNLHQTSNWLGGVVGYHVSLTRHSPSDTEGPEFKPRLSHLLFAEHSFCVVWCYGGFFWGMVELRGGGTHFFVIWWGLHTTGETGTIKNMKCVARLGGMQDFVLKSIHEVQNLRSSL